MSTGRVIAEFVSYDEMLAAVRARVNELQVNGQGFESFAGLPAGYLSKLVGIRPIRRIAMTSMGPLFAALGIRCVMIEDLEATARLRQRLKPRNNSFLRPTYTMRVVTDRQWRQIQKLGRTARWQKLPKTQRSEIMRLVSHARKNASKSVAKSRYAATSIPNGSKPEK